MITHPSSGLLKRSFQTLSNNERQNKLFKNFESLAEKFLKVPKKEVDEERTESEGGEHSKTTAYL